jgi:hypothetical protein
MSQPREEKKPKGTLPRHEVAGCADYIELE